MSAAATIPRATIAAGLRRTVLSVALAVTVLLLVAGSHAAAEPAGPGSPQVATSQIAPADAPEPEDRGLRPDQRSRVLAARVRDTLVVAGAIGGALAVGALAGGLQPALMAGAAVAVAYMAIP